MRKYVFEYGNATLTFDFNDPWGFFFMGILTCFYLWFFCDRKVIRQEEKQIEDFLK